MYDKVLLLANRAIVMARLRIRELAEDKGLSLEELLELANVSLESISDNISPLGLLPGTSGTTDIEVNNITPEKAAELRKVANKLGIPILELFKPVAKPIAFKLRILEKLQEQKITFEELSERSQVHPALIAYYSTQAMTKEILEQEPHQGNIQKISEVLKSSPDKLQIVTDLPITRINIQEYINYRGLNLEDLKIINDLPTEFVDLIQNNLISPDNFKNISSDLQVFYNITCIFCQCPRCPQCCPQ